MGTPTRDTPQPVPPHSPTSISSRGEALLERVQKLEVILASSLAELADHELVAEVRHIGLLGVVELTHDDPDLGEPRGRAPA